MLGRSELVSLRSMGGPMSDLSALKIPLELNSVEPLYEICSNRYVFFLPLTCSTTRAGT